MKKAAIFALLFCTLGFNAYAMLSKNTNKERSILQQETNAKKTFPTQRDYKHFIKNRDLSRSQERDKKERRYTHSDDER